MLCLEKREASNFVFYYDEVVVFTLDNRKIVYLLNKLLT
ncbi:MAG: hypothetical protein ACJAWS_002852 [Oleiphilaceae bacterium]|jgi:hypothetical protein